MEEELGEGLKRFKKFYQKQGVRVPVLISLYYLCVSPLSSYALHFEHLLKYSLLVFIFYRINHPGVSEDSI